MDDERRPKDNPFLSQVKAVASNVGLLAIIVALAYLLKHGYLRADSRQARGVSNDWIWLAISSVMLAFGISYLFSGSASIYFRNYKRSDNPIGYWLAVVGTLVISGTVMIGTLGDMFGLWRW